MGGSFSNAPRDIKTLSGVQLKVRLKRNAAFRKEGSVITSPEERGKPRHGVLQQLSARRVQQLKPHFFLHPRLHSWGADPPFHLWLCPAETPSGQPPALLCMTLQQTEEREKVRNFCPDTIFARPSPLHVFQLNIYDNLPVKRFVGRTDAAEGRRPAWESFPSLSISLGGDVSSIFE